MPSQPVLPADLPALVDAFARTASAFLELAESCSPADFARPTECPGWTVQDLVSHVVGLESFLEGQAPPEVDVSGLPHVRNEVGRFMETWVQARRGRPGADVVAELRRVLPRRLGHLRETVDRPDELTDTPFGPRPRLAAMQLRVIDVWCHEQDLRVALGRPGNLDSPGAAVFLRSVLDALPAVVARRADVPVGTTVVVVCTGPLEARAAVRVVAGDGRPRGEPVAPDDLEAADVMDGAPPMTTTITVPTEDLTRRGAGRRTVDELHYAVTGDAEVARRVLEHLPVTP